MRPLRQAFAIAWATAVGWLIAVSIVSCAYQPKAADKAVGQAGAASAQVAVQDEPHQNVTTGQEGVGNVAHTISAINDAWTLRMAVISLGVVAAAYPVGKLIWILGSKLSGSGPRNNGGLDA